LTRITTVINQKGGVGKTSTAHALATGLKHKGFSVARDIRDGIEAKAQELNAPIYKTVIREGVSVKEAQTSQQSLFDYSPASNPAQDYMDFIGEYLTQAKGGVINGS